MSGEPRLSWKIWRVCVWKPSVCAFEARVINNALRLKREGSPINAQMEKKKEEETTFCTQLKKKITEKKLLFFLSLLAPRCAKVLCITSRKSKKERKARCLFSLEAFERRRAKSRSVLRFQFSFVRVLLVLKFGSRPPKGKSYYFLRGDVFSAPRFHHVLLSARRHMLFFCQFFFSTCHDGALSAPRDASELDFSSFPKCQRKYSVN